MAPWGLGFKISKPVVLSWFSLLRVAYRSRLSFLGWRGGLPRTGVCRVGFQWTLALYEASPEASSALSRNMGRSPQKTLKPRVDPRAPHTVCLVEGERSPHGDLLELGPAFTGSCSPGKERLLIRVVRPKQNHQCQFPPSGSCCQKKLGSH